MGFFNKIKQNFNHGGIKLTMQAPASTSLIDANLPVTLTITATDQPQNIKRVYVQIEATSNTVGFNQSNDVQHDNQAMMHIVARADAVEAFSLQPGESKTVTLSIVMNQGSALLNALPQSGAIANAVHALQAFDQQANGNNYTYSLHGIADVDGIAIDPSTSQPLQVFSAGQAGGAINFKM